MIVGAAQIRLFPEREKNLATIKRWIRKAAGQGVDLLLFPETSLTGYIYDAFLDIREADIQQDLADIKRVAAGEGISVVVGTPIWENSRMYNSVAIYLEDGREYVYHKNRLVSYEKEYFTEGSEMLTFELGGITFGPIVCRDQSFPDLARRCKEAGAQVLLISCAHFYKPNEARLKIDKNRALPIARASENKMYVCKANSIGTITGNINLGHSIFVGPNGIVLSEAGETQEELLAVDIDPSFDWSW